MPTSRWPQSGGHGTWRPSAKNQHNTITPSRTKYYQQGPVISRPYTTLSRQTTHTPQSQQPDRYKHLPTLLGNQPSFRHYCTVTTKTENSPPPAPLLSKMRSISRRTPPPPPIPPLPFLPVPESNATDDPLLRSLSPDLVTETVPDRASPKNAQTS